jgi:hypothetical protein
MKTVKSLQDKEPVWQRKQSTQLIPNDRFSSKLLCIGLKNILSFSNLISNSDRCSLDWELKWISYKEYENLTFIICYFRILFRCEWFVYLSYIWLSKKREMEENVHQNKKMRRGCYVNILLMARNESKSSSRIFSFQTQQERNNTQQH